MIATHPHQIASVGWTVPEMIREKVHGQRHAAYNAELPAYALVEDKEIGYIKVRTKNQPRRRHSLECYTLRTNPSQELV